MRPILWILVFGPPAVALLGCLWVGSRSGNIEPWKRVRLGKYGYWMTLAIIYGAILATALAEHKL